MTPEERAEKILSRIAPQVDWAVEIHEAIAAQIREAEEEAGKKVGAACDRIAMTTFERIRAEAYEDAARIAEASPMQPGAVIHVEQVRTTEPYVTGQEWGDHIARRIRARAAEVGKWQITE